MFLKLKLNRICLQEPMSKEKRKNLRLPKKKQLKAEKKKAEKKARAEQQEKLIESAKTKEGENVSDNGNISDVAPSVNIVADGIVPSSVPVETIGAKLDIKA